MPRRKKAKAPAAIHLLDTNVLLRFLIGDDPPKAARATALMERVERLEEWVEISEAVLTETVWTLESFYQVPRAETAQKLAALLSFAGVRAGARDVLVHALQLYSGSSADFVDCLLAAQATHRQVPVYTFDETDFKKLAVPWEKP